MVTMDITALTYGSATVRLPASATAEEQEAVWGVPDHRVEVDLLSIDHSKRERPSITAGVEAPVGARPVGSF
jgi:hypothetical protein